jgi:hypothetical protein
MPEGLKRGLLWGARTAIDLMIAIYIWHVVVPEDWRWLSAEQIDDLATIAPPMMIGYLFGYYADDIRRWLQHWLQHWLR